MTFTLTSPRGVARATDGLPTRALTYYQPWAWLCASGHKPLENRPKGTIPLDFRGEHWIHAGMESKASIASWPEALRLAALNLGETFKIPHARELTFGAIIGRATITGVLPPPGELPDGWRMAGKFGFVLEGARLLEKPVPCRGFQGFWTVPAAVLDEIRKAT